MITRSLRRFFSKSDPSKEILESLTYYEILKVKPDSNKQQIRGAYLKLARKFHPDLQNEPSVIVK